MCGAVVFSPESDSDVPINSKITISCGNATSITYTLNIEGIDQPSVTVEGDSVELTITNYCSIKAYGTNAEGNSETQQAQYYTMQPYTRYTDFHAEGGAQYIPTGNYIFVGAVSTGSSAGLYYMAEQDGDGRKARKIQPLEDGRLPVDTKYAITITNESNGKYSLQTAEGKYITVTPDEWSDYGITETDDPDGNDLWDVHFGDDNTISFIWNGSYAHGVFKFNPQELFFKNYEAYAAEAMEPLRLYAIDIPQCRNFTYSPADGSTVTRGSTVKLSCINAAKIFYFIDDNDPVCVEGDTAEVIIDHDCHIGAYAENANEKTPDIYEASYTVSEHPAPSAAPSEVTIVDEEMTDGKVEVMAGQTVSFRAEGAARMACMQSKTDEWDQTIESWQYAVGDTFVFTPTSASANLTVIPFDAYGVAYKKKAFEVNVAMTTYSLSFDDTDFYGLYLPYDATIPEEVNAYTATLEAEATVLHLSKLETDFIPRNTAVIVNSETAAGPTEFRPYSVWWESAVEGNVLQGVIEDTPVASLEAANAGKTVLTLGIKDGVVAFRKPAGSSIRAYHIYLLIDSPTPGSETSSIKICLAGTPTDIDRPVIEGRHADDQTLYNLAGQRVNGLTKGILITNGRKEIRP